LRDEWAVRNGFEDVNYFMAPVIGPGSEKEKE
jgi:hypothetical protein